MGKLKTIPPRIGALPPRLGFASGDKKAADKSRNDAAPWRAWYGLARWKALRLFVFARDGYICQRPGALCSGTGKMANAPVANHTRPHRGNPDLFWDPNNVETVTKQVHDTIIQAEEQAIPQGQWD